MSNLLSRQRDLIQQALALHNDLVLTKSLTEDERNVFAFNKNLLISVISACDPVKATPVERPRPVPRSGVVSDQAPRNPVKFVTEPAPVVAAGPAPAAVALSRRASAVATHEEFSPEEDWSEEEDAVDWDKQEEDAMDDFDRLLAKRLPSD